MRGVLFCLILTVSVFVKICSSYVTRSASVSRRLRRRVRSVVVDGEDTSPRATFSLRDLDAVERFPKLIVFDLDNTLWTPDLYQIRQRQAPVPNKDIRLFPDAALILAYLAQRELRVPASNVQLALASRTSKSSWAYQLLDGFVVQGRPLRELFAFVEIYTGSKRKHFESLRASCSNVAYHNMLFFDDDARLNLGEVSSMGVLCCHTPHGITIDHFVASVLAFQQRKSAHADGHWMGDVLNAESLNLVTSVDPQHSRSNVHTGRVLTGTVKFYSAPKRFGFVRDGESSHEYFFHESKIPAGSVVQKGDTVVFESAVDGQGRASAVLLSMNGVTQTEAMGVDSRTPIASNNVSDDMLSMPCFSMSQPFASLLLNGVKTVESRNNNMFAKLAPGTQVLLHCGRRDWPDQTSFRKILMEHRDNNDHTEIDRLCRLPEGFGKGHVVGVVTVGATYRRDTHSVVPTTLERHVLAPGDAVGRFCTPIAKAAWLSHSVPLVRGGPGIFTVEIPKTCLPEDCEHTNAF
jgi:magnesium-dependent phosphatase 1